MKLSPRAKRLQEVFNLTEKKWQKIWDFQKGLCAMCRKHMKKPNVDHCHKTGLIRGLLCNLCNRNLGRFRDSIELLQAAISYLLNPPAIDALGESIFGLPGRIGTKKQRKLIIQRRKQNLQS